MVFLGPADSPRFEHSLQQTEQEDKKADSDSCPPGIERALEDYKNLYRPVYNDSEYRPKTLPTHRSGVYRYHDSGDRIHLHVAHLMHSPKAYRSKHNSSQR